jgi:hypothetical protein
MSDASPYFNMTPVSKTIGDAAKAVAKANMPKPPEPTIKPKEWPARKREPRRSQSKLP